MSIDGVERDFNCIRLTWSGNEKIADMLHKQHGLVPLESIIGKGHIIRMDKVIEGSHISELYIQMWNEYLQRRRD